MLSRYITSVYWCVRAAHSSELPAHARRVAPSCPAPPAPLQSLTHPPLCASGRRAATTIATVGYGDVVPTTDAERGYVILCLFIGASFFSFIVGSVCGVIAKLMEKETIFEGQMTNLNAFIRAAKLKGDLPTRLRAYFRYQNTTTRMADWTDILDKLTPALRGAVAIQMHSSWCGGEAPRAMWRFSSLCTRCS